tara:strand:+ start:3765 stop:3968 length:204 start_codon:yes stop_codon:yes gene_type:complete
MRPDDSGRIYFRLFWLTCSVSATEKLPYLFSVWYFFIQNQLLARLNFLIHPILFSLVRTLISSRDDL